MILFVCRRGRTIRRNRYEIVNAVVVRCDDEMRSERVRIHPLYTYPLYTVEYCSRIFDEVKT